MRITKLIKFLQDNKREYGDIEVQYDGKNWLQYDDIEEEDFFVDEESDFGEIVTLVLQK